MIKKIQKHFRDAKEKRLFRKLYAYSEGYRLKIIFLTIVSVVNSLSSILIAMMTKEIIDAA